MTPLLFQILSAANSGGDDARQIVKLLIDNNADVDLSDETGQTPLWLASLYGNVEIVKMLIAKGAKVDAKYNNQTALDIATEMSNIEDTDMNLKKNFQEIVDLLTKKNVSE